MENFSEPNDVDELLRNAELRSELEPYLDESIQCVTVQYLPLHQENDYLAAMLAWETAPIRPIYQWFSPELVLPSPRLLSDENITQLLPDLLNQLSEKKIILDFTDHLSDRELYTLICCDILPAKEKQIESRNSELRWDCSHLGNEHASRMSGYCTDDDSDSWL